MVEAVDLDLKLLLAWEDSEKDKDVSEGVRSKLSTTPLKLKCLMR